MSVAYKLLGQVFPSAGVLSTAYAVPNGLSAVVSTLFACNHAVAEDEIRVSVAQAGQPDAAKQYLYGGLVGVAGLPLRAKDTFCSTTGIALAAGDVVRVWSKNGTTSFNLFGSEGT